jgi:alpha-N-acetylglucosaminidase
MALLLITLPSGLAVQPAYDLISRNFGPAATAAFQLSIDTTACPVSKLCFSLWQNGTSVAITASSMSELTYGIGYYVRFSCGLTVGWRHGGGSHTHSDQWPCHGSHGSQPLTPLMRERTVPYTYEDNVCTHSYSYVWYDEAEWVAHIDWMALQGVNVFLALTGQEEVQYKAFRKFGLDDTEIREFFDGPAYLTWSRGQDIQSAGASALPEGGTSGLPRSWMQSQWALQKKILRLTRSLGIVGVLPAFQGNMPPGIKRLHPQANISLTNPTQRTWNGTKGECAWVASTDPLFGTVADAWMETLIADFGTDHWYQCDGCAAHAPHSPACARAARLLP